MILDNEQDLMKSKIFEEDDSSRSDLLKMSSQQSIRQLVTQKVKGHNSQRNDYYEIFELACDDLETCKKWVTIV